MSTATENVVFTNKAIVNAKGIVVNTTYLPQSTFQVSGATTLQGSTAIQGGQIYPPTKMTGTSTVISGAAYGNGTYTASYSTDFSGSPAWYAFDRTLSTGAGTNSVYNAGNPSPYGAGGASTSTTDAFTSTPYTGAWVQIQLPSAIILQYHSMVGPLIEETRMPTIFQVFGSINGTTWYLVDSRTGQTTWTSPQVFNTYVPTTAVAYSYFRLVANTLLGNWGNWVINEWLLYGASPTSFYSIGGNVGIGVTNPSAALQVAGNVYASNAMTTTNVFATGNVVASGNLTVSGAAGTSALTTVNVTGNVYASNAVTTPNVFASNVNFASATLGTAVAGQLQYNTYLYGTINTTSGRGSVPTDYIYRLTGTVLSSATTILNFFTGTAAGTGSLINLEASSVYNIEALCYFTKTNAGTVTWQLVAGSAPFLVSASYTASPITGLVASPGTTTAAAVLAYVWTQGQTTTPFAATGSLTTGVNHSFLFKIQVVTNAATTFGIFATQSALSLTALAGSYYRVTKISTTTGAFA